MYRLVVCLAVLAGCTDDEPPRDILDQLGDLPGVTVAEWMPPTDFPVEVGYRYFDLTFTQPIDHEHPSETFTQHAYLMHRDAAAPLVLYTSGYGAGWRHFLTEPAATLHANQLSIDYRFYAQSRPANPDWSTLTVKQNVADEHAILGWMGEIYSGATVQTGGSKGGENSLFHLWLEPGDLDGVVAYVAPVITAFPDGRYATVLDDIGIAACTASLRALQREMLVRRAALEARAAADDAYAIAGVAHAFETAVVELEFSFWMTRGESNCVEVPATAATDEALYQFLVDTGGPAAYGDADLIEYGQQYIYQDHLELGYPVWQHAHLDDLLMFSYEDWSAYMPAPRPTYDPSMAVGLADWLATGPDRVIFVGGEWDPWSPGYPTIPTDPDTLVFSVSHGSHWSSGLYSVADSEYAAATAALQRWTGAITTRRAPLPRGSMATRGPDVQTRTR